MLTINPQTSITAVGAELPIELPEAKSHLRIVGEDLDTEVQAALEAAIDYCEATTGRALRLSTTVVQTYWQWPCEPIRFDRQPVKSITSITYWSDLGVSTTLSGSNYRLHKSTEAAAYVDFDNSVFTRPLLYAREDAVTITYVAGYESLTAIPARAKHAIKLKLSELFGDLDPRQMEAARRSCDDLLASIDWGSYR